MPGYCPFHGIHLAEWTSPSVRLSETRYAHRHRIAPHAHVDATLAFVVAGGFAERQGSRLLQCGPASVLFRRAGVEHDDAFADHASGCFNIEIKASFFDGSTESRVDTHCGRAAWAATRLLVEFRDPSPRDALALEALVAEIVDLLGPVRPTKRPAGIRRVVERLNDAFSEPWSLEALARGAGVHPMHLARCFRRDFGESVGEYVRRLRVQHACRELARSSSSVADIARTSGFADQAHLTRVFHKHIGVPPARFRSLFGGGTRLRTFKTGEGTLD